MPVVFGEGVGVEFSLDCRPPVPPERHRDVVRQGAKLPIQPKGMRISIAVIAEA